MRFGRIGIAVNQFKAMSHLPQHRRPTMNSDKRARANHVAVGLFGCGPKDQRIRPKLRQRWREAAIAHRGLEQHKGVYILRGALSQNPTQRGIINGFFTRFKNGKAGPG
jgi:hypothetical protein